ncbi:MAG: large conductance mechanosensitive channel protein MscL [Clostridia bacterium]|jgi:large conductance mechanosensitive channel|nr:large conductance mechanosensitive channel protein MscL [Clostridia bacterium]
MEKKKRKKSTFFSDFKAFITKGNVMDMAVGVVIGSAFSAIVNSLVKDIIMPLLNLATGNGVEGLSVVLNGVNKYLEDGSINPEAILWNYGNFLQSIINFLIIALCIFTTLRIIMNIRKASEKIAEKAKHTFDSKPEDAPAEAAQEVVAASAEEEQKQQEQATQDAQPQEEVAAEAAQEVAKETVEDLQVKESQEDILRQIRDLLLTMQPKEKQSAPKQPAKKTNKTK